MFPLCTYFFPFVASNTFLVVYLISFLFFRDCACCRHMRHLFVPFACATPKFETRAHTWFSPRLFRRLCIISIWHFSSCVLSNNSHFFGHFRSASGAATSSTTTAGRCWSPRVPAPSSSVGADAVADADADATSSSSSSSSCCPGPCCDGNF